MAATGWKETVDLWLCRLAGLPVSEAWERPPEPPTGKQIVVTACILGGYFITAAVHLSVAYDRSPDTDAFSTYADLQWVFFPAAAVVATVKMASGDPTAPKRLAVRSVCLREAMVDHGLGVAGTDACRAASKILLLIMLVSFSTGELKEGVKAYNVSKDTTVVNLALSAIEFIIKTQIRLLFWTVLYRSSSQPLAELGIVEDVSRELAASEPEPEQILAPEEGAGRPGPPPLTLHRCRLLIAVCDQANKLRLESNAWLHVPSCVMMFVIAYFSPIMLKELSESPDSALLKFHVAIGTVLKLAPIFCAQLVKHKKEVLVQKVARAVDRATDPELRRALRKLRIVADEKFPDSPCVLLDFDLSFLPILINATLLMTTTIYQRESN